MIKIISLRTSFIDLLGAYGYVGNYVLVGATCRWVLTPVSLQNIKLFMKPACGLRTKSTVQVSGPSLQL